MKHYRRYRLKRGNIIMNHELRFASHLEEIIWKYKKKLKGYELERVH